MSEFHEGEVIYLKYMRFADSNQIDYRINGRPYLVFKVVGDKLLLLKIGSKSFEPGYFFSKINVIYKKEKRESYVDMRYYYMVEAKRIALAFDSMFNDNNTHAKKSIHGSKISNKELNEIKNQVKILEGMNEIKLANLGKKSNKKSKK